MVNPIQAWQKATPKKVRRVVFPNQLKVGFGNFRSKKVGSLAKIHR